MLKARISAPPTPAPPRPLKLAMFSNSIMCRSRYRSHSQFLFVLCAIGLGAAIYESPRAHAKVADDGLRTYPNQIELRGATSSHRILVSAFIEGRWMDVTEKCQFESTSPDIATVDSLGVARPVKDGVAVVRVRYETQTADVRVGVKQGQETLPVSFELAVQPILTAQGCSVGACHGKSRGQNGFQLSLLCFDPEFDYVALTREARGRRISFASPASSLLLRKASGQTPHGGGARLRTDGDDYQTLLRWIDAGAPREVAEEPELERIEIFPRSRRMTPREVQRTLVVAHYSDGQVKDVTASSAFQSNESAIVGVDDGGVIQAGPLPGEATVMARFMGRITTCSVLIPLAGDVSDEYYKELPQNNFVDQHVWNKLKLLGVTPSEPADDAKYLRRAYLDIIGRIPSADEVREFVADERPEKRRLVVDQLLDRPEYADHWANKWADLLRPNPYRVGIKAVLNYDNWIREQFRSNVPYDEFARRLVTAQGSTWRNGAATMFRDRRSPDELATMFSQLFLGVRLECAKCHHHPFEKWSQEDFYSFAAYFARVGRKGTGLSPPISGGEEMILVSNRGAVSHPRTGQTLSPRPLFGSAPEIVEGDDPRVALAEWLTSKDNHFFAQVIVNRIWADLMGRGLVEPVDDLRATNPPSNEPLLDALAADFQKSNYDLKHLIRTIANSRVYALSSRPTDRNVSDVRNYSRHYRVRLRAETLVDAVRDITGRPFGFPAMPEDSRANQIWTHRVKSIFLDTFGRPDPNQDPPCERTSDTTVTQALHLMNSAEIHGKISENNGRAHQLAASDRSSGEIVEELYLTIFNRYPTDRERREVAAVIPAPPVDRRQRIEDLMWSMMNSPEFVFKD